MHGHFKREASLPNKFKFKWQTLNHFLKIIIDQNRIQKN